MLGDQAETIKKKILIVEDIEFNVDLLEQLLEDDYELLIARDGQAGVEKARADRPDLILMDLRMPILGGVEAIRQIRAKDSTAKVIVFTTYDGDEDIYRGLEAGAMAYMLKDTPRQELLDTIRTVNSGKKVISPDVAAKLTDRMMSPSLTGRELDVLRLVAQGLSNRNIGNELSITEGTVKTHVNSLLNKLDVQDRTHPALGAEDRRDLGRDGISVGRRELLIIVISPVAVILD